MHDPFDKGSTGSYKSTEKCLNQTYREFKKRFTEDNSKLEAKGKLVTWKVGKEKPKSISHLCKFISITECITPSWKCEYFSMVGVEDCGEV